VEGRSIVFELRVPSPRPEDEDEGEGDTDGEEEEPKAGVGPPDEEEKVPPPLRRLRESSPSTSVPVACATTGVAAQGAEPDAVPAAPVPCGPATDRSK
jgi:hypothetical protein